MLTTDAFHAWCHRLRLSPEAADRIATIRSAPPVRRVTGRAGNVAGRYPSPKMQRTIQFESQHVELWAIYAMERDDDVVEYYDQPGRMPLRYRAVSGRATTQWHTPDFFVLRQDSAGWEEWKPLHALEVLAVRMPARYGQTPTGQWRCPPGEAYAEPLGLTYRVRSSAEYHPLYIQNLKFLQDFWAHPAPIDPEQERLVLGHVAAHPGLCLTDLLTAYPALAVDSVWALLATRRVFTDLTHAPLMRHDQVRLYSDEAAARQTPAPALPAPGAQTLASPLAWDGRLWLVEAIGETVTLQPDVGQTLTLPAGQVQRLLAVGAMQMVSAATPSPTAQAVRRALEQASPKAQDTANRRLRVLLAVAQGEQTTAAARSLQRWRAAYHAAEAQYGCGYLGLLDRVAARGNRTPRAPHASVQLLDTYLKNHYATPQAARAAAVYRLYREACTQQGLAPVSERTLYRVRARLMTPEMTARRLGQRAAYAVQPFFWHLDQTTPRHGERPFAIAHLDHTELDIVLVSSVTGQPLGRPWATLLLDAYSRRILAVYVTYDAPSYRSAMMALRLCVQRHQRLPQELVVDRGPEFGSVYFETLLARYFMTKKERPAQQPRFGSVVERLFGTTTTTFLTQLLGNTQATKTPRQMTREVDPTRLAVWTLERFAARLSAWAYDVYDQLEHPALGQSPRDAFAYGMQLAGGRLHRLIPYGDEFLMLTRPTTRTGHATVDPSRGLTVNGLHYWHPAFRAPQVARSAVPVRYEPFDMSVVYAFVEGQWVECVADDFAQVHGRSEREWQLILEEWRQQRRHHGQKRVRVNGALLAQFLEDIAAEEQVLLQRQRDLEGQAIRAAICGTPVVPTRPRPQTEDEPLDLTTIPHYEAYR
jgi:putative transposase